MKRQQEKAKHASLFRDEENSSIVSRSTLLDLGPCQQTPSQYNYISVWWFSPGSRISLKNQFRKSRFGMTVNEFHWLAQIIGLAGKWYSNGHVQEGI